MGATAPRASTMLLLLPLPLLLPPLLLLLLLPPLLLLLPLPPLLPPLLPPVPKQCPQQTRAQHGLAQRGLRDLTAWPPHRSRAPGVPPLPQALPPGMPHPHRSPREGGAPKGQRD